MAEPEIPGVVMNQEYRVKLGKSFTFPKENAFHTIKYDFKPLSVDHSKPGKLRVGEGDEVNMSLPVVQAESADDVSQFRGPKRPCTRECVLIINTETGEAILEKIGSSVNLKSVRDGRPKAARDRSISPAPFPSKSQAKMAQPGKHQTSTHHKRSKVPKPPTKSSAKKASEASGSGSGTVAGGGTGKPPSVGGSTPKVKKSQKNNPTVASTIHSDMQASPFLTLPKTTSVTSTHVQSINELAPLDQLANQPTELAAQHKQMLEESSGSSSDSGSSSSSSGSSDSESEEEEEAPTFAAVPSGYPGSGGGVNVTPAGAGHLNMPSLQTSQPMAKAPLSMPLFGGNSGGVPISIPPYPVQPSRNEDSSSSSGSDSDSSSDSSSGSSSGSSDIAAGKDPNSTLPATHPPQLSRSISTLQHELSCTSSDSD